MITIDYRFAMKEFVRSGLGKKELDAVLKKARDVSKGLEKEKKAGLLGFANVLSDESMVQSTLALAKEYEGRVDNVVVLGIGGSALGARTIASALKPVRELEIKQGKPRLFVLDNIDPDWLKDFYQIAFSGKSLFLAISKSGATAEIASQMLFLLKRLKEVFGEAWKQKLIIVTDPEKGLLRSFAKNYQLKTLEVPPEVGGRYSVLTPVGLLPAALIGVNIERLMQGAKDMDKICFQQSKAPSPAELLAGIYYQFARKGRKILVMMPYSTKLADFSEWFAQLWAESLGKLNNFSGKKVRAGSTPVRALGATDQHSQLQLYLEGPEDKLVNFLKIEEFAEPIAIPDTMAGLEELNWLSGHSIAELLNVEQFATSASLARANAPSLTISIPKLDAYHLAALFYVFEMATVIAGGLWNVNPFDQPGVELGKQYTSALMGRPGFDEKKKELNQFNKKGKKYLWQKIERG